MSKKRNGENYFFVFFVLAVASALVGVCLATQFPENEYVKRVITVSHAAMAVIAAYLVFRFFAFCFAFVFGRQDAWPHKKDRVSKGIVDSDNPFEPPGSD